MKLLHSGKVRDVYLDDSGDGDDLVLVASDRISIYDVVLPTPIPDKGAVLTQLSLWWFARLTDLVPHHVLSATDVPPEFAGRALRCRRLDMLPVECIARGYLAGLGLKEYERNGTVSGVALPPGLVEGSRLPEPIFTPTTKAPVGEHDEFLTFADVEALVGAATAERLRTLTLEVYGRGAALAETRGILVADTKLEFGLDRQGTIVLADEVLTPDSSRFWPADRWAPGGPQYSYDKQFVRDWSAGPEMAWWDRTPPGPEVPPDVVAATRARYTEVYEALTGVHLAMAQEAVCSTYRCRASDGSVAAATEQGFCVLAVDSGIHDLHALTVEPARVLGARSAPLGVGWVLRRGGPVRIHVRAKDLRRPGRPESVLAAVDTALAHVTPTTYGRPTGRAA